MSNLYHALSNPILPICIRSSKSTPRPRYLFAHSITVFKLFFMNKSRLSSVISNNSDSPIGCLMYSLFTSLKYLSIVSSKFMSGAYILARSFLVVVLKVFNISSRFNLFFWSLIKNFSIDFTYDSTIDFSVQSFIIFMS